MRAAVNPLQWAATEAGEIDTALLPTWDDLARELGGLGYGALHTLAERPQELEAFRAALEAGGLAAAPGYFWFPAAEPDRLDDAVAGARDAARVHAALGLTEIFVADGLNPTRRARPGRGADADQSRLRLVAEGFTRVGEALRAEGVTGCLHQHVASWVETEGEFHAVLDAVDPELLAAGPDTGHLAFAGADPVAVLRDLGRRARVAHVKDVHLDVPRRAPDAGYADLVRAGVWTEPGRGDVDLDACLAQLAAVGAGWVVVEVDRPDGLPPHESAARAAAWLHGRVSPAPGAETTNTTPATTGSPADV